MHIQNQRKAINNYLDDFLFVARTAGLCNWMIQQFLDLCKELGVTVSMEKTEWASNYIVFLGILLDGIHFTLRIPLEKRTRAVALLNNMMSKKKATVKEFQVLCSYLNFLAKAIFPGRTFIRCMYSKFSGIMNIKYLEGSHRESESIKEKFKLRQHHHVRLNKEFKFDCKVWLDFLRRKTSCVNDISTVVCHPMIVVLGQFTTSQEICFYSDASAVKNLGFGCIFNSKWLRGDWNEEFITQKEPSIEYLELFTLTAGLITWASELSNCRIIIFYNNMAVAHMLNNLTLGCKNCMFLLRILVLNDLRFNRLVAARHVKTLDNGLADALSRNQMTRFWKLGAHINKIRDEIHDSVWPIEKLWQEWINKTVYFFQEHRLKGRRNRHHLCQHLQDFPQSKFRLLSMN